MTKSEIQRLHYIIFHKKPVIFVFFASLAIFFIGNKKIKKTKKIHILLQMQHDFNEFISTIKVV